MKGLIIDHKTKYIAALTELFPEAELVRHGKFDPSDTEKYDFIVLSGGPINISGPQDIAEEKRFLLSTSKPILGVCLGHQMLGVANGSKLLQLRGNREGFFDISILGAAGKIFYNHEWYIKELPQGFSLLANDGEIITAMHHKTKPILSVQGHPEMSGEYGRKIRDIFIERFVKPTLKQN
jgi:GMP synthase-like glutamine amidotransferase